MTRGLATIATVATLLSTLSMGTLLAGCQRGPKILKEGQRCKVGSKKAKCAKGLKCYKGRCRDVSGNNPECQYLKSAVNAIMNARPEDILKKYKGKYEFDPGTVQQSSDEAARMAGWFAHGLPQDSCRYHIMCSLPKLGIGEGWFWTRAAYAGNHKVPSEWGAVVPKKTAVQLVSVDEFKMDTIGDDKKLYPLLKIKQMKDHRVGCHAKVKFRVREKFAGFVTFHFWANTQCQLIEPEKGKPDSQPKWECKGQKRLDDPDYTFTVYLYPYDQQTLKQFGVNKKGKKNNVTFLTGNPGTYVVDVWAHNPIREDLFDQHKQFDEKKLEELSQYPDFKFCPKYTRNPFNDGCGCVGFVPSKITITVDPDPFFMPSPNERPECQEKK